MTDGSLAFMVRGCQWMHTLLCALPLYRCHLSHKQRDNSWVNYPSSSASHGSLRLSHLYTHNHIYTHTHTDIHSPSLTTAKSTHRLQTNINTLRPRQNYLPADLVGSFVSRMEFSDLLLSTDVQRGLHKVERLTRWVFACMWGLVSMASERAFLMLYRLEQRRGLDGILVTCSCY